jgi:hypothetical protein
VVLKDRCANRVRLLIWSSDRTDPVHHQEGCVACGAAGEIHGASTALLRWVHEEVRRPPRDSSKAWLDEYVANRDPRGAEP